ncbi:MAG: sigma-70 family RNA polymerase sigma factor, partial [Bdellovibrionota bacterium]
MSLNKKNIKKPIDSKVRKVDAELITDDTPVNEAAEISDDASLVPLTPTLEKSIARVQDPLTLYLTEIRKYPLLSREQESEIAKKYFETKDPNLAQTLVKSNLRFVVKIAAEYAKFSSKLIDVIQEGNVGLMHAVKEFNPYKGNRLITYAVWWIRGYIQEYLMRQFSMVRIGTTANQRKLFYQLQRQKLELEKMSSPENVTLLSH